MFSEVYPALSRRGHNTTSPAAAIVSLSADTAVQYILADIPLFTIGLLAFGVFTFFLVLRRVNRLVLFLHLSVLMSFTAAILDLVEILASGRNPADANANVDPALGLIIAREILYAASFGMRFLFFWTFVSWIPYGETPPRNGLMHNGSWGRWGLLGMILQWTSLAAIFLITMSQIIYRVDSALQKFGPVYELEGGLQITVSFVFILKLLLNSYLAALHSAPLTFRWMALIHYLPVIVALMLSAGMGVGNVLEFLFSETVLGRFLQAIELYILILYVMIYTFFHLRHIPSMPVPTRRINRSSSFHGLPPAGSPDSGFQIRTPYVSTPDLVSAIQRRQPYDEAEKSQRSYRPSLINTRASSISRISTWLIPGRFSRRGFPLGSPGIANDRLWNQDDAERGMSPDDDGKMQRDSFDQSLTEPKQSAKYQDPMFTAILRGSGSTGDLLSARKSSPALPSLTVPPPALYRTSGADFVMPPTPVSSARLTDSPIYGLSGVIRPARRPPSPAEQTQPIDDPYTYFDQSARSSGISGLLRQQAELDRSIAALKLFSEITEASESQRSSVETVVLDTPKPVSASQSDFSLSIFPEPPWGRASVDTVRRSAPTQADADINAAAADLASLGEQDFELLAPPVMLGASGDHSRSLSIPFSETGDVETSGRSPRTDSAGTQYEITSFIGGLTRPGHKKDDSSATQSARSIADAGSPAFRSRTLLQPITESPLSQTSELRATPFERGLPTRSRTLDSSELPQQAVPGPYAGRFRSASTTNRPIGLPSGPKMGLTGQFSSREEFERPRPAPSPTPAKSM